MEICEFDNQLNLEYKKRLQVDFDLFASFAFREVDQDLSRQKLDDQKLSQILDSIKGEESCLVLMFFLIEKFTAKTSADASEFKKLWCVVDKRLKFSCETKFREKIYSSEKLKEKLQNLLYSLDLVELETTFLERNWSSTL